MIAGVLLSFRLWVSTRSYPLLPVSARLPHIVFPFDYAILLAMILLAFAVVWSARPRTFSFALTGLTLGLGLLDQSRWQPWVYQYTFMLLALGLFSWKSVDIQGRNNAFNTCRLIVASIYFWSGLHKLNVDFVTDMLPWMLSPILKTITVALLSYLAAAASVLETGIGLGLLTRRYRRFAVALAIAMHIFILLVLGPLGRDWNSVIWPWNLAMIAFVLLLFPKSADFSFKDVLWIQKCAFQKGVLVLFAVLPLFSFFGLWDAYLSFALYSGGLDRADVFISNQAAERLPHDFYEKYTDEIDETRDRISLREWSIGELNVPVYPEPRVYKLLAKNICNQAGNSADIQLVVYGKYTLIEPFKEETYRCRELQN